MHKMMAGDPLPRTKEIDSMNILRSIREKHNLHTQAAQGFLKAGLSNNLWGDQDMEIVKEAREAWWSTTSDKYPNMRAKINDELKLVKDLWEDGDLPCRPGGGVRSS